MEANVNEGLCVSHLRGVWPLYVYVVYFADEDHEMELKAYKWTSLIAIRALTVFCVLCWGNLGYKGNPMLKQYIIDWLSIIYYIVRGHYMMTRLVSVSPAVAVWGTVEPWNENAYIGMLTCSLWQW